MIPPFILPLPLQAYLQKKLLETAQKPVALAVWGPLGTEKENVVATWHEMKFDVEHRLHTVMCHEDLKADDFPEINSRESYYFHNIEMLPSPLQENLLQQIRQKPECLPVLAVSSGLPLANLVAAGLFLKPLADYFSQAVQIPDLASRSDELPDLLENARGLINERYHLKIEPLSAAVLNAVSLHEWNGNTAELLAAYQAACLRKKQGELLASDLYGS